MGGGADDGVRDGSKSSKCLTLIPRGRLYSTDILTLTKVFASPTCWPGFQNDNFFPNNKFSVWSHVMKYVSLGTAKLNNVDPQSIC